MSKPLSFLTKISEYIVLKNGLGSLHAISVSGVIWKCVKFFSLRSSFLNFSWFDLTRLGLILSKSRFDWVFFVTLVLIVLFLIKFSNRKIFFLVAWIFFVCFTVWWVIYSNVWYTFLSCKLWVKGPFAPWYGSLSSSCIWPWRRSICACRVWSFYQNECFISISSDLFFVSMKRFVWFFVFWWSI